MLQVCVSLGGIASSLFSPLGTGPGPILTCSAVSDRAKLKLQTEKEDQWDTCFELNADLPRDDLYLGFSALTGDVSDAHE
jgi:hypothetical protein